MPETIIIISILISISVVFVLNAQQNKNQKQQIIDQFKSYGEVTSKDNHFYFHIHDETYELLFFKVPYNIELTINSKHMWVIHYKPNS